MHVDIAIIGGGLIGTSLALALHDSGLKVALIEGQLPPAGGGGEWDSRVYAISPGSKDMLAGLGVWSALDAARIAAVEEMHIFGDDGRSELKFSAYEAGLAELAYIVENRALQQVLWRALQARPDVELCAPASCRTLTFAADHALLQLIDGRELTARLVVGADGADSWVRKQTAIGVKVHAYQQQAVVANFSIELAHADVAFQWFRRNEVLALLPLPGKRVSMVWSCAEEAAAQLMQMTAAELAVHTETTVGGKLGRMEVITPAGAFPLRLQRVQRLVQPRVALIGDAAHMVHPLAGQGVNLGFRDVRELASVLQQRGPQGDVGDYRLLRRFERVRAEDIWSMQLATDGLQRLFGGSELARLRNWGLRVTDRQLHLKNLLVQHAVG